MRNRDYIKKKQAIKHASQLHWKKFQELRNKVNIEMRNAKSKYFQDKIDDCSKSNDRKKTWIFINSLLGKNNKSTNVSELSINNAEPQTLKAWLIYLMIILLILGQNWQQKMRTNQ